MAAAKHDEVIPERLNVLSLGVNWQSAAITEI